MTTMDGDLSSRIRARLADRAEVRGTRATRVDDRMTGRGSTVMIGGVYGIMSLQELIEDEVLPEVFREGSRLVGLHRDGDDQVIDAKYLSADELRARVHQEVRLEMTVIEKDKDGNEIEITKERRLTKDEAGELVSSYYRNVPKYVGIRSQPFLTDDGFVWTPGYHRPTGVYMHPRHDYGSAIEEVTREGFDAASDWVLNELLADFPWASGASKANYLAALLTPLMRGALRPGGVKQTSFAHRPLVLVTARARGTGKTLLTEILSTVYSAATTTMKVGKGSEDELQKTVLAQLRGSTDVFVFDNVPTGWQIESAVLAMILTQARYEGRVLGSSTMATVENGALFLVTGNNIGVQGDLVSRALLVDLDFDGDPLRRDTRQNALGDLDEWLSNEENAVLLFRQLCTIVRYWQQVGAPRSDGPRAHRFESWARAVGGVLEMMGVEGLNGNAAGLEAADDTLVDLQRFLAAWYREYGTRGVSATELRSELDKSAFEVSKFSEDEIPAEFRDSRDDILTTRALGRRLKAHAGHVVDDAVGYRLTSARNPKTRVVEWLVTTYDDRR